MKLKIRSKLFIGFGTILLLMLMVGVVGWWNVYTLKSGLDENQEHLNGTIALANAESALWRLRYGFPQFMVLGPEERAQIIAEEPLHYKTINENIQRYANGLHTPEEQKALAEFQEVFAKYLAARPRWFQLQNEGKTEEAAKWRAATTTPFGADSVIALKRLIDLSRESSITHVIGEKERAERLEVISISLILFALAASIFLGFLISRTITRPLIKAIGVADQVSKGKLSGEIAVQSNDNTETGQLIRAMRSMTDYLKEMAETSDSIAAGNLSVEVRPRSVDDRFGNSFQKMVVSIKREITERKRAEEASYKLASIVESSEDAIISLDLNGKILSWNTGAERTFGYSAKEVIGQPVSILYPPDRLDEEPQIIERIKRGESIDHYETVSVTKEGKHLPISLTISAIKNADGNLAGISKIARDITERKRTEEALRENEEKFRDLFDNANDIIYTRDLEGNITSLNKTGERVMGYTQNEAVGMNIAQVIAPEYLEQVRQMLSREIEEQTPTPYEFVLITKNGERRWLEVSSRLIYENGIPAGAQGIGRDITERKRVETEREATAEIAQSIITASELDELFKAVHHSIGKVISAENCFVALHDANSDLIHFEYWVDKVDPLSPPPPRPRPAGKGFADYVLRTGQPVLLTEEIRNQLYEQGEVEKSGTRSASWMGVPLRTQSRVLGVLAVQDYEKDSVYSQHDLEFLALIGNQLALAVERKQNEIELQKRESKLIEAQEIAHVGSWEWDIVADKITWSDELYRIFGLQPQEFGATYEAFLNCLHIDDREKVTNVVGAALGTLGFLNLDHRVVQPDGTIRFCTSNGKVIRDESGRPVKMLGIAQDITDRKLLEEELEHARDAALETARLKSEFLANMSHEIRTPMNGVIGMTGLLLDTELTDEQREFTETLRSSADSLLTVINDILDFSKIEAGHLHFEKQNFDLRNVVESTVGLLAKDAQDKKIELASLVASDAPTLVRGDAGRLKQVLLNLVSNAVKFTERGEVTVCVNKETETETDATFHFSVRDTGIGISVKQQKRLFQPFVQTDGSTTRKYGGTGLGLAISKQIVEMMGGEIVVESEPGKGSTFSFTVQLEKQAIEPAAAMTAMPRADLHNLRVLIVDDNTTNRKILTHQTTSWGMIPLEAENGKLALDLLRAAAENAEPFDVALLDFNLPEMDGFELARAIKTDPRLSGVRLVLMPSFGNRGDGQTAREIGIAAYLMKPIRQSQLFDCLATVMGEIEDEASGAPPDPNTLITRHSLKENNHAQHTRILIAEDNIVNQKVAKRQVEKLGYSVDVVANGLEALDALSKNSYQIVLMDCQMPEMDGYTATAEIRRREGKEKHTAIIALTANALEGELEKCLAAGMDDYLSKPVNAKDLQNALERWQPLSENIQTTVSSQNTSVKQSSAPVDIERLREAADNDQEILQELIEMYFEQMSENLEKLKMAVKDDAPEEIKRLAHTMLGGSATCGMVAVVSPLRELEQADYDERRLNDALPLIARIEEELERTQTFLKDSLMPGKFL